MLETSGRRRARRARPGKRKGRKGVNMSARARPQRVCSAAASGGRLTLVVLACAALAASGSQAFALIIPIQAILTGGGEVPANDSPGKGLMTGTFDTDTNTLDMDGHLFRPVRPGDRRPFPRPRLLSRTDPGGERADPGRHAGRSREPVPRHRPDQRRPSEGPQGRALLLQRAHQEVPRRRDFAAPSSEAPPSLAAPPLLVDEGVAAAARRLTRRRRGREPRRSRAKLTSDPLPRPIRSGRPSVTHCRGLRSRKDIDDVIAYIAEMQC